MSIQPSTPVERFASIVRFLSAAVAAQTGWGIPLQLIALITTRLREIKQAVERIAARVQAGSYKPRRFAPRRPPVVSRPKQQNMLWRKSGWLLPLVSQAVGCRSWLEALLRDPEMAALMQAAPASLGRPIRSLCRMLMVQPPPILAPPKRPRPPRNPRSAPPKPPRPPAPQPPEWIRTMPRSIRLPGPRLRGPPKRARAAPGAAARP